MGPEFFQTMMGRRHYEGTMPEIAQSLHGIWMELHELNKNLRWMRKAQAETPPAECAEAGGQPE